MDYLIFDTLEQANAANRAIFEVGAAYAASRGVTVDPDGIRGFVDGQVAPPDRQKTVSWFTPQQRLDGKWIVRHPKHSGAVQRNPEAEALLAPVVDGLTVEEYSEDWFDRSEI